MPLSMYIHMLVHTLACHPERSVEGGYQSRANNTQKKLTCQISRRTDTWDSFASSVLRPTQTLYYRREVRTWSHAGRRGLL